MAPSEKDFEFDPNFKGITYPLLFLSHPERGLLKSGSTYGLVLAMFTTALNAEKALEPRKSNKWLIEEVASPEDMITLLARCAQENIAFIAFDSFEPTGCVASVEHIRALVQDEMT